MKRSTRLSLSSLAIAVALAGQGLYQPAFAEVATGKPDSLLAPVAGELRADPDVRYGRLANGMRYALMRNATPASHASLRLRIDAGSLHEKEDQRGLAHFIEHMSLNETRNVPEGEFIRILERHGLKFGPDTNAFTSFEQTVYMLDLPSTAAETLDTALMLMREAAGEATLRIEAINRERGIVLSEERSRATPGYRMAIDELSYLFRGDLLPERIPIGKTEVVSQAPRERFVEFYNAYYRPERTTLIAVGDFDLDAMEAKLRARFGDWQDSGRNGSEPAAASLPERTTESRVFVEAGVPTRVALNWVAPYDATPDSPAQRAQRSTEQLALNILARRLEKLSAGDAPHLLASAAMRQRHAQRGEAVQIIGVSQPDNWAAALATIENEQRRALQHGFSQTELDREIAEMRSRLSAQAEGAATRPSAAIAMGLVNAINSDEVFVSPADQLALFERTVAALTLEQVNAAFRGLFAGNGPLLHLSTPVAVEGGEQALSAAFAQASSAPVAALEAQQALSWPYQDFGKSGEVSERRELAELDTTLVRFANGTRLTVKPTKFSEEQIAVQVRFGGGSLALSADRPSPAVGLASGGFVGAGVGALSFEQIGEVLSGRVYNIAAAVGEDAFVLSGQTRPQDFATQLQLLAAYVKDPAWRPSAWDRIRGLAGTIHDRLETSPSGVLNRDLQSLLRAGDRRFGTPTRDELANMPIDALREALGKALDAGELEVLIVGDIAVDEAIRQTAATLGALPPRAATDSNATAGEVRFPSAGEVKRSHRGRADQALAFIAWPTTDFFSDPKRARGLDLLSQVLQLRLNDEIREKQGAAYSPRAMHSASRASAGFGYLAVSVEVQPDAVDGFMADARRIASELATAPVEADELERARRPLVESLQRQRNSSNGWWVGQLAGLHEHKQRTDVIRDELAHFAALTPADLQQLAGEYLIDTRAWTLRVTPGAQ